MKIELFAFFCYVAADHSNSAYAYVVGLIFVPTLTEYSPPLEGRDCPVHRRAPFCSPQKMRPPEGWRTRYPMRCEKFRALIGELPLGLET